MKEQLMPLVVAAVAVILQILVAPIIPIFSVYPNFIVALVIVLAIVRNPDSVYPYAFVLGLLSDLLADTPVGLTPLLLLAASFALSRAFEALDKATFAMPAIAICITALAFEVVTALVLAILGYGNFIELFVQRALVATVVESVIGVLAYLLADRASLAQSSNDAWTVSGTNRYR